MEVDLSNRLVSVNSQPSILRRTGRGRGEGNRNYGRGCQKLNIMGRVYSWIQRKVGQVNGGKTILTIKRTSSIEKYIFEGEEKG